eukprot:15477432-Alexandrium_andersonii.AAC.1
MQQFLHSPTTKTGDRAPVSHPALAIEDVHRVADDVLRSPAPVALGAPLGSDKKRCLWAELANRIYPRARRA